jgi:hypothetical protein
MKVVGSNEILVVLFKFSCTERRKYNVFGLDKYRFLLQLWFNIWAEQSRTFISSYVSWQRTKQFVPLGLWASVPKFLLSG